MESGKVYLPKQTKNTFNNDKSSTCLIIKKGGSTNSLFLWEEWLVRHEILMISFWTCVHSHRKRIRMHTIPGVCEGRLDCMASLCMTGLGSVLVSIRVSSSANTGKLNRCWHACTNSVWNQPQHYHDWTSCNDLYKFTHMTLQAKQLWCTLIPLSP